MRGSHRPTAESKHFSVFVTCSRHDTKPSDIFNFFTSPPTSVTEHIRRPQRQSGRMSLRTCRLPSRLPVARTRSHPWTCCQSDHRQHSLRFLQR